MKKLILSVLFMFGLIGQSNANLIYAEGPDLNAFNSDFGVLNLGLSTVSGSLSGNCQTFPIFNTTINQCAGDSQDIIKFSLDVGHQLDSVSLAFFNVSKPSQLTIGIEHFGGIVNEIFSSDLTSAITPTINNPTSPFGYDFTITTDRLPPDIALGAFSVGYVFSIITSEIPVIVVEPTPVPEPQTLLIAALGLLIMLSIKKKAYKNI